MKNYTFLLFLLISSFGYAQLSLPFDFESAPVTADFTDFDGGTATVIANPQSSGINTSANVAQIVRDGGQPWAGSKVVLPTNIDFSNGNAFSMKVFSPAAGIPILFKLEGGDVHEVSMNTTVANEWETIVWDYTGHTSGTYSEVVFIFDFGTVGDGSANSTFLFDDVELIDLTGGLSQIDLPVDFEGSTVNYALTDFGENMSSLIVDPEDATNMVIQTTKPANAAGWAGTTMSTPAGFATAIPFTASNTKMTVRVWSPDAGIPVMLKAELAGTPEISVQTRAMTTMAGAWETIEFDFANEQPETAPLNLANTYNLASIFFNIDIDGATAGEKTYYWDDVEFVGGGLAQIDLPITFDDPNTDYTLSPFGENIAAVVVDPTDATNMVGEAIKPTNAALWAGVTMSGDAGLASAIPFTLTGEKITVRVWSPDADTPILLKVEDAADPGISSEVEVSTTMAMAWETLEFDFSAGTPALNLANTYDKISIFFNFGTDGATAGEKIYYWDDVIFVPGTGLSQIDLPITFDDANTDYTLSPFGENIAAVVVDPTDATNMVGEAIKPVNAFSWAGVTMSGDAGLASAIPFTLTGEKITARVWSPDAGTPILLKVENATDGDIFSQVLATTTMAMAWETLEFDFSTGEFPVNLANTYEKISIFFNIDIDGATAGEKTYYWDDVIFVPGAALDQVDLPITFEDANTNYDLVGFGENIAAVVEDPTDAANTVGQAIKPVNAPVWAGVTMGGSGLATAIPFTETMTKVTVRVWSPDAGTPILLKVEDAADAGISSEVEVSTTMAMTWETLEFDFATGAPALNLANTYDKISIFFNFGVDGATAGEKTYYWDDVIFGGIVGVETVNALDYNISIFPNPASSYVNIEFPEAVNEKIQARIFNANGSLVKKELIFNQTSKIYLDELSSGSYFLRLDTKEASYVQKIVVLK